jgi:hypothetical protein
MMDPVASKAARLSYEHGRYVPTWGYMSALAGMPMSHPIGALS